MDVDAKHWIFVLFSTAAIFFDMGLAGTSDWTYSKHNGPLRWCDVDKQCCGMFQSPIDIGSAFRIRFPHAVTYSNYDLAQEYQLTNTGKTAMLTIGNGRQWTPMLTGGPLTGWYVFQEAHFHWGLKSSRGSEHTINGRQLPLEMHIVHKNIKYETEEEAYKHADGLSVVSVLFQVSTSIDSSFTTADDENVGLRPLIKALKRITCKDQRTTVRLALDSLLPMDRANYVSYYGSVTRPPCSQAVTWILLERFGRIGESQMSLLRQLRKKHETFFKCGKRLVDNFRPTQKINHRMVLEMQ